MASLKELRNRIGSVKSTQKITKAMQMVAAAKLRRAQDAARTRGPMPSAWRGDRQPRGGVTPGAAPKLLPAPARTSAT
jgi:F-type H+-transporting ATPase subunit gamma